jgi:hypothetical protein
MMSAGGDAHELRRVRRETPQHLAHAAAMRQGGRLVPAVDHDGFGVAGIGRVDGGEDLDQPRRGPRHVAMLDRQ